jgi:dihydroflavonol-4-reductase
VKAFVTGGTGFVGGRLVAKLRERGDEVVALVRSRARAERLGALGCELVEGKLGDRGALARALAGSEALFHVAAIYKIGIPESQRAAMFAANVTGTINVLDAAADAGVRRIVYVSTNNVLGNTRGAVVDETYVRDHEPGFLSAYDESKLLAHDAALERIARGAPIVIVQPGGIYGPGDHTAMGSMFAAAFRGRPTLLPFGGVGLNWVHVDDVAAGILLAHDCGAIGETYILGGEIATLREAVAQAYAAGGHRPRILPVPTVLVRALAPLGPLLGRNVSEFVSASDRVTYWGKDEKARRELGYAPRELAAGLRDTFAS